MRVARVCRRFFSAAPRSRDLFKPVPGDAPVVRDMKSIPIVDFAKWKDGSSATRAAIAQEVIDSCRVLGFFQVKNHTVPRPLIDAAFEQSKQFFRLPAEVKLSMEWETPESNRGYIGVGREHLDGDRPVDVKESMDIGNEKEKDFRNRWPTAHLPKFRPTMLELFDEADKMHLEILRAVGIGLGLEENFFDKHCNEQHENLRLLHYPPVADARKLPKGQARAGGHTDYGTVTLLFQDQVGGLEVLSPQNQWIAAHPVPYGIVINVGDLLAQWSNDVLKSNLHRVVTPATVAPDGAQVWPERYSIAFFANPNKNTIVECLPSCTNAENPPKYKPVRAYDHLVSKLSATIPGKY